LITVICHDSSTTSFTYAAGSQVKTL